MRIENRAIVVELPQRMTLQGARAFLRATCPLLDADQPRLVFDFSRVQAIDSVGVEILLESLDRVVRNDGDLKVAAVPPEVAVVLELTCVDRLFEVFASCSDAIASYSSFSADAVQRGLHASSRTQAESKIGIRTDDFKMTG